MFAKNSHVVCLLGILSTTLGHAFTVSPSLGLDIGQSQSLSYEARSLFVNPAGLAFQKELNSGNLLSSFSYAKQRNLDDAYAFAASLGAFGFGVEQIPQTDGDLTRYSFGLGIAVSRVWFLGLRQRLFRGNSVSLSGFSSSDISFQLRPAQWLALGGTVTALNRPANYEESIDSLKALGVTLRPLDLVDLSLDLIERSLGHWRYLVKTVVRPLDGLTLELGHDQQTGFQAGLRLAVSTAGLFAKYQPDAAQRSTILGVDLSPIPYRGSLQPSTTLRVEVDDSLSEAGTAETFLSSGRPSFLELMRKLDDTRSRSHVKQVIVQIKSFPLGLASAFEFFEAIAALGKAGKETVVSLGQAGIKEYLIASAAQKIWIEPSGEIRLTGLGVQRYFLKGTLDKIGVQGEFLAKGDYKSAPETFTRKESSRVSKEAAMEELRRAEKVIVEALALRGRIGPEQWRSMVSRALYSPEEAKDVGLVDGIVEYLAQSKKIRWRDSVVEKVDLLALPDRIAIVSLSGEILEDKSLASRFLADEAITPQRVDKLLRVAVSDERTRAIILRISSPGGEVLASRKIAGIVERCEKPVYVSMGDVAASGGYMISAPAKRIFASPLTYTGSIGVFLGKANLNELYKKIDLHKEILSDSNTAGLYSEHKGWSKEEEAVLQNRVNQYYGDFTRYVSTKRKLSAAQVEMAANGRVWLGVAAWEKLLVDDLLGISASIRRVAELEGISEYITAVVEPSLTLSDFFAPSGLLSADAKALVSAVIGLDLSAGEITLLTRSLRENPVLYWESTLLK